jgi:hypothetical protein
MISRSRRKLVIGLVLLASLILLKSPRVSAQSSAFVSIEPNSATLDMGESARIELTIQQASQVFGFEIQLNFDPRIIQMVDQDADSDGVQVSDGDFFDVEQGFIAANRVDNETGVMLYAITLLAPATPVNGDGILLSFEMEPIAVGRSNLTLSSVLLASTDGESLPVNLDSGEVEVVGAPGDTPLPSFTPTNSPTATLEQTPSPTFTATSSSTATLEESPTTLPTNTAVETLIPSSPTFTVQPDSTQEIPTIITMTFPSPLPNTPVSEGTPTVELVASTTLTPTGVMPGETDEPGGKISWEILVATALIILLIAIQIGRYYWKRGTNGDQS